MLLLIIDTIRMPTRQRYSQSVIELRVTVTLVAGVHTAAVGGGAGTAPGECVATVVVPTFLVRVRRRPVAVLATSCAQHTRYKHRLSIRVYVNVMASLEI